MFGLPKGTEFNRRIPKQKFYDKLSITSAMKRMFVDQIDLIFWRNKIAASTVNIAPGEQVKEIEVIEIKLSDTNFDTSVLQLLDKEIPYHIIFLLEYEGKYQAWMAYKRTAESGVHSFKVETYYHTDWSEESALPLKIEGLNLDKVYENFVRQIAGEALYASENESLEESVERSELRKQLERQIERLKSKIGREKQFNKQVELNRELRKLKSKLEEI